MQDATNMEKGEFKCTFQEQKSMFESGDIHQWDISLTCQVLLRTKHSCSKLKTDSKYSGYKKAIKKISEIKNTCFSHAKSLEVERAEFESIRRSLKEAALSLGVTEDEFEEILKGNFEVLLFSFCRRLTNRMLFAACSIANYDNILETITVYQKNHAILNKFSVSSRYKFL